LFSIVQLHDSARVNARNYYVTAILTRLFGEKRRPHCRLGALVIIRIHAVSKDRA
jgi:hypothetical protein